MLQWSVRAAGWLKGRLARQPVVRQCAARPVRSSASPRLLVKESLSAAAQETGMIVIMGWRLVMRQITIVEFVFQDSSRSNVSCKSSNNEEKSHSFSFRQHRHTLFNLHTSESCLAIVTQVWDWTALTCALEVATSGSLAFGQPFA